MQWQEWDNEKKLQMCLNWVIGIRGRREEAKDSDSPSVTQEGDGEKRLEGGEGGEERMRLEAPVNEREEEGGVLPCFH